MLGPCDNVAEIASLIMIVIATSDAKLASRRQVAKRHHTSLSQESRTRGKCVMAAHRCFVAKPCYFLGLCSETRVFLCVLETTVRAYLHDATIRQGSGKQAPDIPNGPVLHRRRFSGAQLHMQLSDQGTLWNM